MAGKEVNLPKNQKKNTHCSKKAGRCGFPLIPDMRVSCHLYLFQKNLPGIASYFLLI